MVRQAAKAVASDGVIERARHGILTRASRGREHVLVANVDQVVIVIALKEPELKPHLIDRYLASAAQGGIEPIICLNKADLVDPAEAQPIVGYYSQLGITTLLTSATHGHGDRAPAQAAQQSAKRYSPGRAASASRRCSTPSSRNSACVSAKSARSTRKGSTPRPRRSSFRSDFGGWVVDTPGIRQFALWDIIPEEVEGFFAEFRANVPLCGFPDCTHTHEEGCAVKQAVALRYLSDQRYFSYLGMFTGKEEAISEE